MDRHKLYVSANGVFVGVLSFDSNRDDFEFAYVESWIARDDAFPLSPHIPLSGKAPQHGSIQRFLQNLLPEGRALDVVAITHQVSRSNIFGLVSLLGKEPVGALSFTHTPVDSNLSERSLDMRRPISSEELSRRIQQRDFIPFPVWDGKVRLSVAGYQDKLQVLVEGEHLSLAEGTLASTHILKPESRNPVTHCMVANEHFCMTLAAQLGLEVAPVEIRRIPEPILLIQRFDRTIEPSPVEDKRVARVLRHHVIDGCQALDLPVSLKYERNFGNGSEVRHIREGASYEKLFGIKDFTNPIACRMSLLRWALIQILLGNSDAHAKNISFYMRRSFVEPAPFYDLVSVNVYGTEVEQEVAMGYGDEFLLEKLGAYDLADFCQRISMPAAVLEREITRLAIRAREIAPVHAQSNLYQGQERELVRAISGHVVKQAAKLLQIAPQIKKVDPKLL